MNKSEGDSINSVMDEFDTESDNFSNEISENSVDDFIMDFNSKYGTKKVSNPSVREPMHSRVPIPVDPSLETFHTASSLEISKNDNEVAPTTNKVSFVSSTYSSRLKTPPSETVQYSKSTRKSSVSSLIPMKAGSKNIVAGNQPNRRKLRIESAPTKIVSPSSNSFSKSENRLKEQIIRKSPIGSIATGMKSSEKQFDIPSYEELQRPIHSRIRVLFTEEEAERLGLASNKVENIGKNQPLFHPVERCHDVLPVYEPNYLNLVYHS